MPASTAQRHDEQHALLRLLASGAAAGGLRRLLDSHGSATAALAAGARDWASHGLGADARAAIRNPGREAIARGECWLDAPGRQLIGWRDPDYPPLLRRISGPPAMLFVAGDAGLLWRPAVAVVGSRAATAGGCANAASFAAALAAAGLCVTSGLAAGIDAAAHNAALDAGGATLAVLGTGPDIAYPPRHRPLLERMATHGAVVSEHLPGTQPLKQHFPSRNRILAGLSLGTLVIEAADRSGALITARLAADAGREVFALPGSIHNPMARGCHRLIREGATLVESADEVLALLGPLAADLARALRGELGTPIAGVEPILETTLPSDPDYNRLWQALGHDPTGMDELVERSGLTAAALSSMLLALELEGRVAAEHGRYCRIGV
ncbi:DNA-processing protein DprA [Thermomonas aquatica]|uniref:DNA-protecting protein DprA n=1 Tax=Thermomonas aquatica TaxID=2202149 RepID=A0A5B7ZRG0_9GAMM|nr:DNA-processing protein DprA [Thermomonas aquatica]QDA57235.1 DNA-protecting protein DprA [Thermomonas aquatica]